MRLIVRPTAVVGVMMLATNAFAQDTDASAPGREPTTSNVAPDEVQREAEGTAFRPPRIR